MTLEEILQRIGSYVDQDSATPTDTDLTIRTKAVNTAYEDWALSYDWDELRGTYTTVSTSESMISVALPTDFVKTQSPLYENTTDLTQPRTYTQIRPNDFEMYAPLEDIFYVEGDRESGFTAIVPKGLVSGATIQLKYQKMPTSLASLGQIPVLSNPNYLVQRGIAFVLESRGDTRFPTAKADAERILSTMLEHQNVITSGGGENRVRDYYSRKGYRIGRR